MVASSIHFQICSFFYMVVLLLVYSKKRILTFENKIYIYMIISNIIGLLLDVFSVYTIINLDKYYILNYVITRFNLIYLLFWETLFCVYTFSICIRGKSELSDVEKKEKRIFKIFLGIFFVFSALVLILPLDYYNNGSYVYSYGLGVTLTYVVGIIYIVICAYKVISNIKNMGKIKCLSLLSYIIIFPIFLLIQLFHPEILLVTSIQSFINFLLYLTIQNFDIEVLDTHKSLKK